MRAWYTLGSPSRYGSKRVARPTSRTSSPVEKGSSVPACPMRRSPIARRATATTSCEVTPAGLSMSRSPSVEGLLIGGDAAIADLLEERLDAGGARDARIGLKGELGREAQSQRSTESCAEVCGRALQPFERGASLHLGAHHTHKDLGVPEILGDVDAGDGHQADDARILCAIGEKGGDLLADGFSNSIG